MRLDKPLVIVVRHGSTKFNESRHGDGSPQRIRGWLNLPLTDEGREESRETAKKVSVFPIEELYCSDLQRAEETAGYIADLVKLPIQPVRALRPWDLGYLTGEKVEKVMPIMKGFVDNEDRKVPGGESFSQFRERCLSFVKAVCEKAAADKKTICLVAHTRNLQLIKAWVANGHPPDFSIDRKTMDDYTNEVAPSGYLAIEPDYAEQEYKSTDVSRDPDKEEQ